MQIHLESGEDCTKKIKKLLEVLSFNQNVKITFRTAYYSEGSGFLEVELNLEDEY